MLTFLLHMYVQYASKQTFLFCFVLRTALFRWTFFLNHIPIHSTFKRMFWTCLFFKTTIMWHIFSQVWNYGLSVWQIRWQSCINVRELQWTHQTTNPLLCQRLLRTYSTDQRQGILYLLFVRGSPSYRPRLTDRSMLVCTCVSIWQVQVFCSGDLVGTMHARAHTQQ